MKTNKEKPDETLRPDLCMIGAGSAGLSAAAIAASLGVSVVLIEKGRMGGECLNTGCMPSKALMAAARRAHEVKGARRFGIEVGKTEINFAEAHRHVKKVVAATAPADSVERYRAMGVHVIEAEARFTGTGTVLAGGQIIQARRFVIATGSRPTIPSIQGLEQVSSLTNETIFDVAERPEHLVVIGGGAVGLELAQTYRRLGSQVTVIEAGERVLGDEDPEMTAVIERALVREGIALSAGRAIERVEPREDGRVAVFLQGEPEPIEGSHLLIAAGRQPVVEGLGLEEAGIKTDASGIVVNRRLQTTNRRVYAIGDCAGGAGAGARFTHVANHHAGLVIRDALFRLSSKVGQAPVLRVFYTDPELAAAGLTEVEARDRHGTVRILRWGFSGNDRARAEGATEGHVKAVVTPRGTILGCAIAGAHAGELIMPWILAMTKGLKVSDLASLVYPYPTFSEVTKSTAVEFLKPSAQNPWMRRAIGWRRRLG